MAMDNTLFPQHASRGSIAMTTTPQYSLGRKVQMTALWHAFPIVKGNLAAPTAAGVFVATVRVVQVATPKQVCAKVTRPARQIAMALNAAMMAAEEFVGLVR